MLVIEGIMQGLTASAFLFDLNLKLNQRTTQAKLFIWHRRPYIISPSLNHFIQNKKIREMV